MNAASENARISYLKCGVPLNPPTPRPTPTPTQPPTGETAECVVTVLPNNGGKTQCNDGIDNDLDGLKDCSDPACWTNPADSNSCDPNRNTEFLQCNDGIDNDLDGLRDALDPGCHTDGDASNSATYNPNDDDEFNNATLACSPNTQTVLVGGVAQLATNGGNSSVWSAPGGAPSSGSGTIFSTSYNSAGNKAVTVSSDGQNVQCSVVVATPTPTPLPQCSDGADNDADGLTDEADPGCHEDNDINKPYDPSDNTEFHIPPLDPNQFQETE